MSKPDLVLFDPFSGGHHGDYLLWLAEAWRERDYPGSLLLAIAPGVLAERSEIGEVAGASGGRIRLEVLAGTERLAAAPSLLVSARHHVRLVNEIVKRHRPARLMAMYLDHAQVALALHRRGPTRFSGLLFRPDLHLPAPVGVASQVRAARKRWLLKSLVTSPTFETLFTLDPTAVPALQRLAGPVPVRAVPDPAFVETATRRPEAVRRQYEVEPGRVLFVLPGALDERKGIFAVLSALLQLSEDVQRRLCIIFAGRGTTGTEGRFEAALDQAKASAFSQLLWDRRFLPGRELQDLIVAADVVLAPYQHHVGSSGIVMRAAAAGRPLIGQAEGLIGHQVRVHGLGQVVPSGNVAALASTVQAATLHPQAGFDQESAAAFCAAHTTNAFAESLFGGLNLPHTVALPTE